MGVSKRVRDLQLGEDNVDRVRESRNDFWPSSRLSHPFVPWAVLARLNQETTEAKLVRHFSKVLLFVVPDLEPRRRSIRRPRFATRKAGEYAPFQPDSSFWNLSRLSPVT